MNPFAWLDRLHARSPVLAYLAALAIAAGCTFALAYLNQDGSAASHLTVSGRVT